MKKKHIQILIFLILAVLLSSPLVMAQGGDNNITITSVVKDDQGNPIAGAKVYGNEGLVVAETDASGNFSITVPDMTDLLIEADGHEPMLLRSGEFRNMKEFSLKQSTFMYGAKDDVYVALRKIKRGDIANAITVINPDELLQYDNNLDILSALQARVPGLLGASNIRGIGTPMFIVDGMPRNISSINLSEVEQIAVLKDINSAVLYGNGALNGVIQITTKRGEARKRQIKVSGLYGISKPTALPEYLNSSDFATLYNEALVNDGLNPLYSAADIANYQSGNKYRYPDIDYYSNEYVRSIKPFSKVWTELTGGGDVSSYYANLGWDRSASLIGFGAGEDGGINNFNARGNVDLRINNWITSALDATAVFNTDRGPVVDYWGSAATLIPNLYSPLLPISLMDAENPLVKARKNDIDGLYMLGGTQAQLINPIASTYSGGYNSNIQRNFAFNNRIDFNLGSIMEGLAFHTNLSFDFYTRFNQVVSNTYAVYEPTWDASNNITALAKYGLDTRSGTQSVTGGYYERRFGLYGMLDYDRTFGDHHINWAITGWGTRFRRMSDIQGTKDADLALRLGYSFRNKYLVNISSVLIHSAKLHPDNSNAISPSIALAWVLSEEDFLSSVAAIDYLKLRASAGIINSDNYIPGFYLYDYRYQTSSTVRWYDRTYSGSSVIPSYGGNADLFFEKRKDLNFGFEGLLFNKSIGIDANVFWSSYYDIVTRPYNAYPSFYSQYVPYENFAARKYSGAELGLNYNRTIGDVFFTLGVNALYNNSEVTKLDEIYLNDYQYRVGKPADAIFGLVADGFFSSDEEIIANPQDFGTIKAGDIKYIDQNNDGVVNADDAVQIGRAQSPFGYALNLRISYKNLTFFAQGNGEMGSDGMLSDNYYWVDGSDKYSTYVMNRWTPAAASTATFPRLSTLSNNNNFRSSDFWLYKDDFFRLRRMQVTYDAPQSLAQTLRMKRLSFFIDGSNIFTVSKVKDIKDLSVGAEPYYRSYSLGIKTVF